MFVYILEVERTGKSYIGSTYDLNSRLCQHNSKKTPSSAKLLERRKDFFTVIHSYAVTNPVRALTLEKYLQGLQKLNYQLVLELIQDVPIYCDWLEAEAYRNIQLSMQERIYLAKKYKFDRRLKLWVGA